MGIGVLSFPGSAAGGASSGTSDRSVTITPGINDLLVVFCAVSVNTNAAPTCSDDQGGTYDLIATALYDTSLNIMSCFVRKQLVTAAVAHVITAATGSNTSGELHAIQVAGMSRLGSKAVVQSMIQENQAFSTTPAPTGNVVNGANAVLGAIGNKSQPAGLSPTTSGGTFVELQDTSEAQPALGLETQGITGGFTSATVTWGSVSNTRFAAIVIELDASSAKKSLFLRQAVNRAATY